MDLFVLIILTSDRDMMYRTMYTILANPSDVFVLFLLTLHCTFLAGVGFTVADFITDIA